MDALAAVSARESANWPIGAEGREYLAATRAGQRKPATALRILVIAADKASGYMEARNLGVEPVAVITPRSLSSARGIVADRIMDATSLTPLMREVLLPHVLPCLATSQPDEVIAFCPTCDAPATVTDASITISHGLNGGHIENRRLCP